jgi:hypothetical protein
MTTCIGVFMVPTGLCFEKPRFTIRPGAAAAPPLLHVFILNRRIMR